MLKLFWICPNLSITTPQWRISIIILLSLLLTLNISSTSICFYIYISSICLLAPSAKNMFKVRKNRISCLTINKYYELLISTCQLGYWMDYSLYKLSKKQKRHCWNVSTNLRGSNSRYLTRRSLISSPILFMQVFNTVSQENIWGHFFDLLTFLVILKQETIFGQKSYFSFFL